jgi:type II secretory ATPase GspE/PulE/Tfp pilus assembly ATPase PilB-like protein
LTGHLVLSTLHTNGVIETFNRLTDMGLEGFLIASTVQLVMAQRLVKKLCPRCAQTVPLPEECIAEFGII